MRRGMTIDEKTEGQRLKRTTITLPESLDFFLRLYALKTNQAMGELIKQAVAEYLKTLGYKNPYEIPPEVRIDILLSQYH